VRRSSQEHPSPDHVKSSQVKSSGSGRSGCLPQASSRLFSPGSSYGIFWRGALRGRQTRIRNPLPKDYTHHFGNYDAKFMSFWEAIRCPRITPPTLGTMFPRMPCSFEVSDCEHCMSRTSDGLMGVQGSGFVRGWSFDCP
jgi:hypothetical protein